MDKIQTVKIENFSNQGDGIARVDGFVIFVQNALPGDVVKIEIQKENKHFARAKILEIIEPSTGRTEPFCHLYNPCGACSLQHAKYAFQLELKKQIVQDSLKNIGNLDIKVEQIIPSPQTTEFRCKIQYPVTQTKISKRILAGYYKTKSHEITNIKHCPIQPKICDEIIEFIRNKGQELNLSCYKENTHKGLLRHIVIRHSAYNHDVLVTIVVNANSVSKYLKELAEAIFNNFEKVKGVCVNFNESKSNVILGKKTELIAGIDTIEEKILDKTFKIASTTFFQVNPKSAENIFGYVKEIISKMENKPDVLDAYAGIASFGIVVSDVAKSVLSVEENKASTDLAKEVLKLNKITNLEIRNDDTGKFLKTCNDKFDVIILDPPRKGCDEITLNESLRLCKKIIIYVSCNPATLARDLKYLTEKNAKIKSVIAFDMFCHSLHVESVAIIEVA